MSITEFLNLIALILGAPIGDLLTAIALGLWRMPTGGAIFLGFVLFCAYHLGRAVWASIHVGWKDR